MTKSERDSRIMEKYENGEIDRDTFDMMMSISAADPDGREAKVIRERLGQGREKMKKEIEEKRKRMTGNEKLWVENTRKIKF